MPYGFGIDPFGKYLGSVDWGKSVLWDSLPRGHRIEDRQELLEKLMRVCADEFNYFKEEGELFAYNKSPFTVRNDEVNSTIKLRWSSPLYGGATPYTPEIIEDSYWGTCVKCKIDPSTTKEDLEAIGPSWTFKVKQKNPAYNALVGTTDDQYATSEFVEVTYTVIRVRTRNDDTVEDNEVWIKSRVLPDFTYQPVDGFVFYQPSILPFLAEEKGIEIDSGDSEFFQRGTIASALEIFSWKATKKGYKGQSEYSGWEIDVTGLWKVEDCTDVPVGNKWIIDGVCYVDVNPRVLQFDDIPADSQYVDPDTGLVSLLDNAIWWEDSSADGMNPAMSFSQNVLNAVPMSLLTNTVQVISSTVLSFSEAQTAGLGFGYKVILSMTQSQRDKLGYITKGVFALRYGTDDYYIEGQESYIGGVTNEWTVYTVSYTHLTLPTKRIV